MVEPLHQGKGLSVGEEQFLGRHHYLRNRLLQQGRECVMFPEPRGHARRSGYHLRVRRHERRLAALSNRRVPVFRLDEGRLQIFPPCFGLSAGYPAEALSQGCYLFVAELGAPRGDQRVHACRLPALWRPAHRVA